MCHVAFSADSLTRACGRRAQLSIYTALSLHKDIFSRLKNQRKDPGFFEPPAVCFCSPRQYLFRDAWSCWHMLLTSLGKGPLTAVTLGPSCLCGFSSQPACCACERIFHSALNPVFTFQQQRSDGVFPVPRLHKCHGGSSSSCPAAWELL